MRLLATQDADPWGGNQPVALHIPARTPEDGMPGGGQARRVGGLAAGDEADAGVFRQSEQVEHPRGGDLLDGGRGRGEGMEGGVLVPCRHQPVRGKRGGQRSADDEAEVPRACGRDKARFSAGGERFDHCGGVLAAFGQRPAKGAAYGRGVGAGGHGPFVERGEKRLRVFGGGAEASGAVGHEPNLRLRTSWRRSRRTRRSSGTAWSRPGAAASSTAWPRRGRPPG